MRLSPKARMRGGAAIAGAIRAKAARRAIPQGAARSRGLHALKSRAAWLYARNPCRRAGELRHLLSNPGPIDTGMSSAPNPDSMVLLDDVRLTLASDAGAVNVLRGISLAVAPGETVSGVGPSGSGKSTMMMIIGGRQRPSTGRVVLAATRLNGGNEGPLAPSPRDPCASVFPSSHPLPTLTR